MIINRSEIEELQRFLDLILSDDEIDPDREPQDDPGFFANRPHLLMALGFDEYRVVSPRGEDWERNEEKTAVQAFGLDEEQSHLAFPHEEFFRQSNSGAWYWYEGIHGYAQRVHFVGPRASGDIHYPLDQWIGILRKLENELDDLARLLWLPGVWTPRAQVSQQMVLAQSVPSLLREISKQALSLRDIPWRQLEEIVAELLRSKGLQVYVTPRSGDGGRDIVARGELVPGEPITMAVEVKQKPVVGIADVQRALRANEDFPVLLMATAGRFSAGVVQERNRNRNHLRLLLKDGSRFLNG